MGPLIDVFVKRSRVQAKANGDKPHDRRVQNMHAVKVLCESLLRCKPWVHRRDWAGTALAARKPGNSASWGHLLVNVGCVLFRTSTYRRASN